MKTRAAILGLVLLLVALPVEAQRRGSFSGRGRVGGTFASGRPSFPAHVRFGHRGFGFSFGFPVFGLGFDAHHFSVLHRHRFFGGPLFVSPFVSPFFPAASAVSSTVVVVVVPQVAPVQVPVVMPIRVPVEAREVRVSEPYVPLAERLVGTPRAEERIQVARPSLPGEPPPPPRFTLLVFKNHSIYAVTDYWLETGQLHYVTSYGGQNAVPFEQLDLEMTVQLNWERGIEFALRPEPARARPEPSRFGATR